ncbi:hypothetical protein GNP80_01165 [Aliivibrio fischeri]|uniref:hypothetical protein n=1 Tax=Aliivibrio fischeri TaxID=668 RepID=UPI0012D88992|nr:hypothetical protein [Aliivibrio fischeri]MUK91056.1 hypothetical protein [Aliivibrio fischeri]
MKKILFLVFASLSLSSFAADPIALSESAPFIAEKDKFYHFIVHKKNHDCKELKVKGFMFGHSHGLPSEPRITTFTKNLCSINGLFFNMNGKWKIMVSSNENDISSYIFDVN